MISVLASETVRPNAEHAVTITAIILSNHFDDRDTIPDSSAYRIPHNLCTSSSSFPPCPSTLPVREVPFFSPSSFRWSCTVLSVMAASARKRFSATRSIAAKNTLNSSGTSTHPCLRPCPTPKLSEHSIIQPHACLHAVVELADDGNHSRLHAKTSKDIPQKGSVDGDICLVRSIIRKNKGVSFRASSCSRPTTNIMPTVER